MMKSGNNMTKKGFVIFLMEKRQKNSLISLIIDSANNFFSSILDFTLVSVKPNYY